MIAELLKRQLEPLEASLGQFLAQQESPAQLEVFWGAVAATRATLNQHACANLAQLAGTKVLPDVEDSPLFPSLETWLPVLQTSQVVGKPGDYRPLILAPGGLLYLYRYWAYEKRLALALSRRAQVNYPLDVAKVRARLNTYQSDQLPDWQKVATVSALCNGLTVLTGGPGTGKTTTVSRILALLLELNPELRIALAAPTGKAAARLKESLEQSLSRLPLSEEVKALMPQEARTLHRLLGYRPQQTEFRHREDNPLPVDVLIVDEASMIDLAMMTKLVEAVPPDARLILLGDRDQLASVEAGSVLGDICEAVSPLDFGPERIALLWQVLEVPADSLQPSQHPLANSTVALTFSRRFGDDSDIGQLARAVNQGESELALRLLREPDYAQVRLLDLPEPTELEHALEQQLQARLQGYLLATEPQGALNALSHSVLLCALKRGPYGVFSLNQRVESMLSRLKLLKLDQPWYHRRPILITANDYAHQLFNGDLGLVWQSGGQTRVWFQQQDGSLRSLSPSRLGPHETAWALTVHKSQGSEYEHVQLILPDKPTPVVTRELIYTGITRAKQSVVIWSPEHVLREALKEQVKRSSGLIEQLGFGA